ncbi:MAG TPA: AAA family ATPase [Thermoanaerobaculia bacterium]|nr:AAA family ATPase [Thermoanaerobaculia bacterium]HQP86502.1 AAA family ATPase [Thermoanaerobaculia bacterium]
MPAAPLESFFLWGPRQTGKSTLLRSLYPEAVWLDLLKTDEQIRYASRPALLREELEAVPPGLLVVIDEVQKAPGLLDEVHWLVENRGRVFALSGSSARKVRRSHANLLGGRAVRFEMFGLTSEEVGPTFDLVRALNHGFLPRHYLSEAPGRLLRSYVTDYLKEEVLAEGLSRNLPAFTTFLAAAALSDGELVSFATIARECGVSAPAVKGWFEVLVDTLLGDFLPAFTKRPKRRVIGAPKFYFADVGVVNHLAKRGRMEPGSALFGKAFESWVRHELRAYSSYRERFFDLSYWRLASGIEVDFVVDDMVAAFEAKATPRVKSDDLNGLRQIRIDHPKLKERFVVSLEPKARVTEDGIVVLPWRVFVERLWGDELI